MLTTRPETWQTMRDQVVRLRGLAVDSNLITGSAVAAASPQYHLKGACLAVSRSDGDVHIRCGPRRIQQVLANLLDKALRHTLVGGHATVAVVPAGRAVRIIVSADGEGNPNDQFEAVFGRSHHVDPSSNSVDGIGGGPGADPWRVIEDVSSGLADLPLPFSGS